MALSWQTETLDFKMPLGNNLLHLKFNCLGNKELFSRWRCLNLSSQTLRQRNERLTVKNLYIWRNRAVIQYHATFSHLKSCLTLQIDKLLAVMGWLWEGIMQGFRWLWDKKVFTMQPVVEMGQCFCHQYFAELSINCWPTCPKSQVIIFLSYINLQDMGVTNTETV